MKDKEWEPKVSADDFGMTSIERLEKENFEFDRLYAEAEIGERAWRESHKSDPCTRCGGTIGVKIHAYGSLARLTPYCGTCWTVIGEITKAYWQGVEAGQKCQRERPWWQRLFQ